MIDAIVERLMAKVSDLGAICVYDIKTGTSGIRPTQLAAVVRVIRDVYNGGLFYIIEVRPRL